MEVWNREKMKKLRSFLAIEWKEEEDE